MRSSRAASKLQSLSKADSAGSNSNGTRSPDLSETGFLLLNAALKPLYINTRAAEILLHPEKPRKAKDFADQLAPKIRAMVTNGDPSGKISVCKEFLSGCRHYICRFFDVHLPGNNSNGSNGSSLALLLERSPRTSVDILKICDQYHLTPREGQTVELLLHGLASKEISARMKISPNTVKVFLRLAMLKMGVSSRSGILSKFINAKT
jgi:DNA-binding CsgD family transcriptional regulator